MKLTGISVLTGLILVSVLGVAHAQTVAVPNVVGLSETAATAAVEAAGLVVGTISTEWSDTVTADDLISQSPVAGTQVLSGSAVDFVASKYGLVSLVSFRGKDGEQPFMENLAQGEDGNLYGTTCVGGVGDVGTVFRVTPTGTLKVLYNFALTDGSCPEAGLMLGTDGNFYGTTYEGGANGYGTVFEMTASGTFTKLHDFAHTDGAYPVGVLILGTDGNLYGTTAYGGMTSCTYGCGTLFKIPLGGGTLTTVALFDNTNGYGPFAGLIEDAGGNFYGTTTGGGSGNLGTVFEFTSGGTLEALYNFSGTNGREPESQLVQEPNGEFVGTTLYGGTDSAGEVFRIDAATQAFKVLKDFDVKNGAEPTDGLILATDGNYYGTSSTGGTAAGEDGTVFKMSSAGKLTTLANFNGKDGGGSLAGLVQYTSGVFYGVTAGGGTSKNCIGGCGTVFGVNLGLAPFVKLLPASGSVGATVTILGNNLSSATSVSFNGTAAVFTPHTDTYMIAVVPSGATTGEVSVKLSSGTLTSSVNFTVSP
jgi:uncharacterized repeat protein (TIGR03803 family)